MSEEKKGASQPNESTWSIPGPGEAIKPPPNAIPKEDPALRDTDPDPDPDATRPNVPRPQR